MEDSSKKILIVVIGVVLLFGLILCGRTKRQARPSKKSESVNSMETKHNSDKPPAVNFADALVKTDSTTANETLFRVTRIIDGDTIEISDGSFAMNLRLIGVDTPELHHPQKPVEFFAQEARDFVESMLLDKQVTLELDPINNSRDHLDRYGRLLAYVYRYPDNIFINAEIIRQGYGFAYTKYPFQYMEQFRSLEREARANQTGLWGSNTDLKTR